MTTAMIVLYLLITGFPLFCMFRVTALADQRALEAEQELLDESNAARAAMESQPSPIAA